MASVQTALEALKNRKDQVALELAKSEKSVRLCILPCLSSTMGLRRADSVLLQLYDMETMYLGAEYSKHGTVLKASGVGCVLHATCPQEQTTDRAQSAGL